MEKEKTWVSSWTSEKAHQICSFMWADSFWIMSHSRRNLEQVLRDLVEEAEKWDLAPKPAACGGQVPARLKKDLRYSLPPTD